MKKHSLSPKNYFYTFILLWLIWYGFTTSLSPAEVTAGAFLSLFVAWITVKYFDCCDPVLLYPGRIVYFIEYFFVFLWALIKANFDVARRVINPSLPINPGIVKFESRLENDFAKMVLADSITLTPGTLTVDVIGNTFYIHWIDVKSENPGEAYREIAENFERILLKIYR